VLLTAWSILLYLAAWVLTDPIRLQHDPAVATVGVGILITCSAIVTTLRNSDSANHAASIIDQLTGLFNRGAFERRIQELERADAPLAEPIGVVLLDIDHFKGVNDGHGHAAGDAVLRDAAYAIRRNLRPFDVVYRLGGEEFLAILPGTGPIRALAIAERLRSTVELGPTGGVPITVSVGVSILSADAEDRSYETMFGRADGALYAAKAAGRNQVVTADPPGTTSNRLFVREERRRRIAEEPDAQQAPQPEDV
ncbi:MAG: GGDEF domain-containing protein, partial [Baekduiaceae bacterium]